MCYQKLTQVISKQYICQEPHIFRHMTFVYLLDIRFSLNFGKKLLKVHTNLKKLTLCNFFKQSVMYKVI